MIQPLKINIIQNHILLKAKIRIIKEFISEFGSDYNYTQGDFKVQGNWGSSARHMDNIGFFLMQDINLTTTQYYPHILE